MTEQKVTYANALGEVLSPLLLTLRSIGFFEAYFYIPAMTLLSIYIYIKLIRTTKVYKKVHLLVMIAYYWLCFIMTNSAAVAFKTLIIEEMDYEKNFWFLHLVSPIHFFIVSVTGAFLWLIYRSSDRALDKALCAYIQIGLLGGYSTAVYRLVSEKFELTDVTSGMSGVILIVLFIILNNDLLNRFIKKGESYSNEGFLEQDNC